MKPYQLIILIFFCLFLTGCSHTGLNVSNPFGGGGLFNRGQNQQNPTQKIPKPPVKRPEEEETQTTDQRSCAADGRDCYPTNNSACTQSQTRGKCCDFPAWLTIATSFIGLNEGGDGTIVPDEVLPRKDYRNQEGYNAEGSNKQVLAFHKKAGHTQGKTFLGVNAWCGSFAWWCLTECINPKTGNPYDGKPYREPKIKGPYENFSPMRARTWATYGQDLGKEPCFGALMVLGNHVSFLVGVIVNKKGARTYLGLGGNQSNVVKITPFGQHKLKNFILPNEYKPCREHSDIEFLKNTKWVKKYLSDNKSSGGKVDGLR